MSIPNVGTYGRLTFGDLSFPTIEREWLNNASNISCIPVGVYECHRHPVKSDRFRLINYKIGVYHQSQSVDEMEAEEAGKPYRWGINVEPANVPSQLMGCIAIGTHHSYILNELGVISSRKAVNKLMDAMSYNEEFVIV